MERFLSAGWKWLWKRRRRFAGASSDGPNRTAFEPCAGKGHWASACGAV